MRNWIKEANNAGNAALSNDFMKIKSFVKRNGTNRRLLGQKVGWDWTEIYEILSNSKQKLEKEIAKLAPEGREQKTKFLECLSYSG
jgi:hypothetical protein